MGNQEKNSMNNPMEQTVKTSNRSSEKGKLVDPFAAAVELQEQIGREYGALADRLKQESPAVASVLLTMRARQGAQLRQLMCLHGFRSRKMDAAIESLPSADKIESPEVSEDLHLKNELKRKMFVLQIIQPGLAGLMDGSVSTLAPVFAAAFATRSSFYAFLVGLAASLGAGISMGFAEALSDDGVLSGRGRPWLRGSVCGTMTMLGGIGHTLPFLIKDFYWAMILAVIVVAIELGTIAWIRNRYMDTPLLSAIFQVVLGGVLVFITGVLIGSF
jgi:erythrin-vacuolar iron transport family protein